MEKILYRYNPWWEEEYKPAVTFKRPGVFAKLKDSLKTRQIVVLTGLRRVGKTTLMKQMISHLIDEQGVDPGLIFYVSLDDYLLTNNTILEIIEEYRKIQRLAFSEKVYLFLDEVTYQKDFELQLKNIYDQQNAKVYVSSSSASILRSKKAFLTGRNVVLEILPLDFEEYLGFKEIVVKKSDRHLLEKYFEDFMQTGGMPEYVLTGDIEYLKELVDDVIQKDIAAFYGVKDVQVLKDFFLLLMERSGKVFSINKIAKILDISPDSAKRYLQMFADSFLIFLVSRFGKTNERLLSAKKIYAADLGMRVYFTGFRDKGSLFENYVYLKIKKFNPSYVYQDGNEIDFLTEGKTLIEVKYNAQMGVDQKELFDKIKVREKILIENIFDLEKISNLEK
ncbi:MAG: Archaeal ATPase family protein [Candidatus Moranbacteria bacterium GW2011_GWE1_36_7]|nr:MAG: Archaeal ATPase family protein [Candidatus Moranbacteria bacterium GW2011_GWD2_36_12]KKQ06596.1 MAG: Archaeal ATPase family protein [Candidatus Moranbacteria bacterium GW2011_GWE2_36_40]KKQ15541.1 MAG: Archaeal ATPase family protein [Candidatus Moranbacteria bacterium GW2011_GWE1_36_7]